MAGDGGFIGMTVVGLQLMILFIVDKAVNFIPN